LSSINQKELIVTNLHPRFQAADLAGTKIQQFLYLVQQNRLEEATDMAMDILPLGYSQAVWLVMAVRTVSTGASSWHHLDDRAVRQAYCQLLTPAEMKIKSADILVKRLEPDYELLLQMALAVQPNYMSALSKMVIHDFAASPSMNFPSADPAHVTLESELNKHGVEGMIARMLAHEGECADRYPAIIKRIIDTLSVRNFNLYRKVVMMAYDYRTPWPALVQ
jgi:hypothetical protein